MPINYSYEGGNANLVTDNPRAREMAQFIGGFSRPEPARRPTDRGGMAIRSGGGSERAINTDAVEEAARVAEARARIAQAKALSDPAPMRSIRGGPGMIGGVGRSGLQLDTSGMTGAQRSVLLPQSSAMASIPDSGASLNASTLQPRQPAPMDADWYSLPDHVRKAILISGGYGNNPVQQREK